MPSLKMTLWCLCRPLAGTAVVNQANGTTIGLALRASILLPSAWRPTRSACYGKASTLPTDWLPMSEATQSLRLCLRLPVPEIFGKRPAKSPVARKASLTLPNDVNSVAQGIHENAKSLCGLAPTWLLEVISKNGGHQSSGTRIKPRVRCPVSPALRVGAALQQTIHALLAHRSRQWRKCHQSRRRYQGDEYLPTTRWPRRIPAQNRKGNGTPRSCSPDVEN